MPEEIKKKEEESKELTLSPEIPKLLDEWTKNPKSKIFVKLAEEYRKSGFLDEALNVCEKGLEANPNYLSGNMVLAKVRFDRGEYQAALDETLKVASVQSDNLMAQNLLLDIYIQFGDKSNALKTCDVISFLDPQNASILNRKLEIETKGITKPPVKKPKPEEEASPEDVQDILTKEFEEQAAATEITEEAFDEEEESSEDFTTNTVAELYIKQGFYEKGLNIYKELLDESPDEPKLIAKIHELEELIASQEIESEVEKISESEDEEKEEKVYELDIGDDEAAEAILDEVRNSIVKNPEAVPAGFEFPGISPEELGRTKVEESAEAVAEEFTVAEPEVPEETAGEISKRDEQIDKLNNWLEKIQSRGGR